MDNYEDRFKVESEEKWSEISSSMPKLRFPESWEVQIIPPFSGAIFRFKVFRNNAEVSVYYDFYDKLGCMREPYFELFPNPEENCDRFLSKETAELIEGIERALVHQENKAKKIY